MQFNIQHCASGQSVALLRQSVGSRLCIAGAVNFRLNPGGWREFGHLVGLRSDTRLTAVFGEPIPDPEVLSFPGIDVIDAANYQGLWTNEIPRLSEIPVFAKDASTSTVIGMQLLRDRVRWRSRVSGDIISITTDLGILMHLGNSDGWFLVLARDSDLGLLQFGYARIRNELDWWFSPAAVVEHWAFVDGDDGQEVLSADRTVIPI